MVRSAGYVGRMSAVRNSVSEPTYTSEAQQYFDRLSTQPSTADKTALAAFIDGCVTNGVWADMDAIWMPRAVTTAANARVNLKSSSFTLTEVSTPTFTSKLGYTGNGTTSYLDTGYNPASSGQFTQNAHSFGVGITANVSDLSSYCDFGVTNTAIFGRTAGGNVDCRSSSTTAMTFAVASALGTTYVRRVSSSSSYVYKNGAELTDFAATSATPTSQTMTFLCRNQGTKTGFSTRTVGWGFIGSISTVAKLAYLNTAIDTLVTAVGS